MTRTGNLIEVNGLRVTFASPSGSVEAVRDMSFRIRPGGCVALVGESGSGKSVTARAILGILGHRATIEAGKILFDDPRTPDSIVDLARLDPASTAFREVRGDRISMIFQEPMTSLSPLHTVGNQISEALELHTELDGTAVEKRCIEMLKLVQFPEPERGYRSYPFELSGGLRQRAMIAMALVCGPSLLIADEPTTALDVTVQAQILALINDLRSELHMAVLIITHDMGVVANIAEEVVVAYRGRVMESGTVDDVLGDPQHPYLQALMSAVPTIDPQGSRRLQPLREIKPVMGSLLTEQLDEPHEDLDRHILEVSNLTKRFTIRSDALSFSNRTERKVTAVDDVSFVIERGECLGLVGESGCGKTTISKLVMGAISPDEGKIGFHDGPELIDLAGKSDREMVRYRRRMQYIFQDPFGSLNPRMTVYDILSEPLRIHSIGDQAYRDEMVSELVVLVGLGVSALNRYPHSFSGGQRQRIGIARALVLRPELLICDEPVSALDVSTQAQVLNLLKDLQSKLGLTYLFISHDLAVVNYIADRVAVMCSGNLVEVGPREAIFNSPQHPYTRALLASVPTVDLDNRLDFAAIRDETADGSRNGERGWPAAFREPEAPAGGAARMGLLELIDVGGGHFVRARRAEFGVVSD